MTNIYIAIKPQRIEINSGRGDYSGISYQNIIMRGAPEYDGTYGKNTDFTFKKDGQSIRFPSNGIVNIRAIKAIKDCFWDHEKKILANSGIDENSKFIGFLHYVPACADSEMCIDSPDLLQMSIYVSKKQLATYIDLIGSRKSTVTAVGTFPGRTMDGSLEEGMFGYDVTWDLDKNRSVCLESFNLNFSFSNEIPEEISNDEQNQCYND